MDISLHHVIPGYTNEPTMMFAHSTYLADIYTSQVEKIYLPEETHSKVVVKLQVTAAQTWESFGDESWKWRLYKSIVDFGWQERILDYSNHFIFDGRYDPNKNFAHVLHRVCDPVLLAQKLLSEFLNQPVKIHVIVPERTSQMALETYKSLGIPTICTSQKVYGNVVRLMAEGGGFQAVEPELFNIDFAGYTSTTPDRVFIARRGSRSLVNNDEVAAFLKQRGFTTVYFETLTTSEKWLIARNAKVAVAVHGAGTGNFIFNRHGLTPGTNRGSGLKLIELYSPCYVIPTYRHFGTVLNGKWCAVRGQITPDMLRYLDFDKTPRNPEKSPIRDPFKIDLLALEMALDYMQVGSSHAPQKILALSQH